MAKHSNVREHFRPTIFKIMETEDKLTAASGLSTIIEVYDQSPMSDYFRKALPYRSTVNNRSGGSYRLGLIQLESFIFGHDCLDDLEEFRDDPMLAAQMKGETVAPRTMGDFLRDFSKENTDEMNVCLSSTARTIRRFLREALPEEHKPAEAVTIDMDSTDHVQYGKKMEGYSKNYKGNWGLYSEVAYDELGLCHGIQLDAGSTKPGSTAVALIEHCFAGLKHTEKKFFRADSAYCYEDVIRICMTLGVTYTITAHHGTSGWRNHIDEITEWTPWVYSEEELEKAKKKEKSFPKVELGRFHWQPSWAENIRIPVIVKRTWIEDCVKKEEKDGQYVLIPEPAHWDYYAVITNWDLFYHPLQEVMQFHMKRGNAENFIREEKYGFDLKHFPCQELSANTAFAQIAMLAHNILRWVALTEKPDKPHFSKKIRRRYIYIPGKIVTHARQLFLRIPARFKKEVEWMKSALRFRPSQPAFTPA